MPHPMTPAKRSPLERLLRTTKYKELNAEQKLAAMLEHNDFKWLLARGLVLDVQAFAAKTGYTPQHVRVLCRQEKIDCIKRGYGASSPQAEEEFQYFFLPEHVTAFFASQKAKV